MLEMDALSVRQQVLKVRPGQSLTIGSTTIHVVAARGKALRLVIESPDGTEVAKREDSGLGVDVLRGILAEDGGEE